MADPTSRRAYEKLAGEKAEKLSRVTMPTAEQSAGVDPSVRLLQIENIERHDHARFVVQNLAAEKEQLLAKQAAAPQDQPARMLSDADSRLKIDAMDGSAQLRVAWGDQADANHARAVESAKDFHTESGAEASEFWGGFNALPGDAQLAAYSAFGEVLPERGVTAPLAAVQSWQADEQLKGLVSEWGSQAPAKMARVASRTKRMLGGMSPSSTDAVDAWLGGMSEAQFRRTVRSLAR
ncbi:MAG: hypothetical protein GEU91_17815 [Rhizobiales bacterium]|nr:hypothetical protein [Hyphomicrobiales bacterium]